MKILFLITDLNKGGAERYLIDLCSELEKHEDIEFIIGSLYNGNQYDEYTRNFKIEYLEYSTFSFFKKNECVKYKELLETFKPDVVHTHRFLGEFLSSYYLDKNIKYICHGHDNMEQLDNFKLSWLFDRRKILNALEKSYLIKKKYSKVPTWILANSKDTYEYYKRVMPNSVKKNILLMPCGFNYSRFYYKRDFSNIDSTKIRLINVSSFADKKNQIFIVEIAKELRKRNVDFEIKLVGIGQNYSKVERAIADNNLGDFVKMCGLQMNVEILYRESDIYLHSAYYEPFGLVLLEAMSSGLPVVTLDGRGNRDIIVQGKNGYMIYEQDVNQFADRILEIWNNRQKHMEMSAFAQDFARQYDMKNYVDKLIDLYHTN